VTAFAYARISLAAFTSLQTMACGATSGAPGDCVGLAESAIYAGRGDAGWIDARTMDAIVAIESDAHTLVCTGLRLRGGWVLTAAHCSEDELAWIRGRNGFPAALERRVLLAPGLDALLVRVEHSQRAAELPLRWATLDARALGTPLTIAGFGLTESGASGQLRFVDEPIVDVTTKELWVDGSGRSGACAGDSGGPAFVVERNGEPELAGILSRGSQDCRGVDAYLRIDTLRDWVAAKTAPATGCP
jgi:hypothetical protein